MPIPSAGGPVRARGCSSRWPRSAADRGGRSGAGRSPRDRGWRRRRAPRPSRRRGCSGRRRRRRRRPRSAPSATTRAAISPGAVEPHPSLTLRPSGAAWSRVTRGAEPLEELAGIGRSGAVAGVEHHPQTRQRTLAGDRRGEMAQIEWSTSSSGQSASICLRICRAGAIRHDVRYPPAPAQTGFCRSSDPDPGPGFRALCTTARTMAQSWSAGALTAPTYR